MCCRTGAQTSSSPSVPGQQTAYQTAQRDLSGRDIPTWTIAARPSASTRRSSLHSQGPAWEIDPREWATTSEPENIRDLLGTCGRMRSGNRSRTRTANTTTGPKHCGLGMGVGFRTASICRSSVAVMSTMSSVEEFPATTCHAGRGFRCGWDSDMEEPILGSFHEVPPTLFPYFHLSQGPACFVARWVSSPHDRGVLRIWHTMFPSQSCTQQPYPVIISMYS
jgi:hypothetical protein